MGEQRTPADELNDLVESLVLALSGVQVRALAIQELSLHDQTKIIRVLKPWLDLTNGINETVDAKLVKILDARLDS